MTTEDLSIAVRVTDRASMEHQLDEAISIARATAMNEGRRGILVTRFGFDSFSVALSNEVPFGETREYQDWQNADASLHSA